MVRVVLIRKGEEANWRPQRSGATRAVCDSTGACDTATVTITINPEPDSPTAVDDVVVTDEDTEITFDVLTGSDSDPDGDLDPASTSAVTLPTDGVLVNNGDGTFRYTPDTDFNGTDSFDYEVCDITGAASCDTVTVTIAVNPVNDAPAAAPSAHETPQNAPLVLTLTDLGASDPDGDPLTLEVVDGAALTGSVVITDAGTTITFTPALDFVGAAGTFDFTVSDRSESANATVTITVIPNLKPIALPDTVPDPVPKRTEIEINVLANDSDPDGALDVISVVIVRDPNNGTVTVDAVTGEIGLGHRGCSLHRGPLIGGTRLPAVPGLSRSPPLRRWPRVTSGQGYVAARPLAVADQRSVD